MDFQSSQRVRSFSVVQFSIWAHPGQDSPSACLIRATIPQARLISLSMYATLLHTAHAQLSLIRSLDVG